MRQLIITASSLRPQSRHKPAPIRLYSTRENRIVARLSLVARRSRRIQASPNRPPAPKHVSHQSTPRAQSVPNFKN